MSDMMTPISFDKLVNWILEEHKKYGTVFGEKHAYTADENITVRSSDARLRLRSDRRQDRIPS